MAVQDTKWIDVLYQVTYGFTFSGYSATLGDISNTQNGTTNNSISGVGSGLTVTYCAYISAGGGVLLTINGSSTPAADVFDTMEIQNSSSSTIATLSASAASTSTDGTSRSWQWSSTNHFGTTTGADYKIIFDDGAASGPAAPTDITFGTDPGTSSSTVSITATASGGGTGTLQVSENNSTWVANGSSFTFTRGTAKTIYARVNASPNPSSSYSESNTVAYLVPDTTITNISNQTINNSATSFSVTIANGGSTTVYEVRSTSYSGTVEGSRTGNGTITVSDAPADNSTKTYYVTGRRPTASGGDNLTDNIQTFNVSAANVLPLTNLDIDEVHVMVGGTTQTTASMNDADIRAISNTDPTYDGGGINQTSGTTVSLGQFRGAYMVSETVNLTGGTASIFAFQDNAFVAWTFSSNGGVYRQLGEGVAAVQQNSNTDWVDTQPPNGTYYIRFTVNSSLTGAGGTVTVPSPGTWLALTSNRQISADQPYDFSEETTSANVTVAISDQSNGSNILDSATYTMSADVLV